MLENLQSSKRMACTLCRRQWEAMAQSTHQTDQKIAMRCTRISVHFSILTDTPPAATLLPLLRMASQGITSSGAYLSVKKIPFRQCGSQHTMCESRAQYINACFLVIHRGWVCQEIIVYQYSLQNAGVQLRSYLLHAAANAQVILYFYVFCSSVVLCYFKKIYKQQEGSMKKYQSSFILNDKMYPASPLSDKRSSHKNCHSPLSHHPSTFSLSHRERNSGRPRLAGRPESHFSGQPTTLPRGNTASLSYLLSAGGIHECPEELKRRERCLKLISFNKRVCVCMREDENEMFLIPKRG